MKIRFTELPDRLKYAPAIRAKLSLIHSDVVIHVSANFDGKASTKQAIVSTLNTLSYLVMTDSDLPSNWSSSDPLKNLPVVDTSVLRDKLRDIYVGTSDIIWDIDISTQDDSDESDEETEESSEPLPTIETYDDLEATDPEDLSLDGPVIPRIDVSKVWKSGVIDGHKYCVYTSLPEIPTCQSEISITTDINQMTTKDFLKLYPTQVFFTRAAEMYSEYDNCIYNETLGAILRIGKFTKKQLLDNIIKYPQVSSIVREGKVDGIKKFVPFYTRIEIDGTLYKTADIWAELDDVAHLPKNKSIMQEYVVRRYLLERDHSGVNHRYKMFGELDPYLTLFMPSAMYVAFGHKDIEKIAEQCVRSRISYKLSRNPVIRRLDENG